MAAQETDEFVCRPTTFIERDGTRLKAARDVAREFGVVREQVLPFKSGELYRGDARRRIQGFGGVRELPEGAEVSMGYLLASAAARPHWITLNRWRQP